MNLDNGLINIIVLKVINIDELLGKASNPGVRSCNAFVCMYIILYIIHIN